MISKERLKELIEQKATVYYVSNNTVEELYIEDYSFWCGKLSKTSIPPDFIDDDDIIDLNRLYETQSEAEFYAKYGNIEKTVKMPVPPTWEELVSYKNESDYYSIRWCQNIFEIDRQYLFCISFKSKTISLRREVDGELNKYLIDEKLTEQNYYKALDKMVKLWREEV